jgi:hypothetical protein
MSASVLSAGMARTTKGPPPEELLQLRTALAMNLRAHMAANEAVRDMPETAAAIEIGRRSGIGKNTILRALGKGKGDDEDRGDMRLDTLVKLAMFFGVAAQDLLRDHSRPRMVGTSKSTSAVRKEHARARTEGSNSEADRAGLHRHRRV